jgi:translation initiation factor IF-3
MKQVSKQISSLIETIENLQLSENDILWKNEQLRKFLEETTRILITGKIKERRYINYGTEFNERTIREV